MSEDDRYLEANFILEKESGAGWNDAETEHFLEEFLEFIESRGMLGGGSIGPMRPPEKDCNYCEGSGRKDFIDEEDRCGTCGGSGRKEEPEPDTEAAEADWNKVYAPIAQRTEQSPPKGKVEGSNPSRSATDETP